MFLGYYHKYLKAEKKRNEEDELGGATSLRSGLGRSQSKDKNGK